METLTTLILATQRFSMIKYVKFLYDYNCRASYMLFSKTALRPVKYDNVTGRSFLLCRLPALAEGHIGITSVVGVGITKKNVTFFSGITQASFLIFGTEHQYGELYRVTQF